MRCSIFLICPQNGCLPIVDPVAGHIGIIKESMAIPCGSYCAVIRIIMVIGYSIVLASVLIGHSIFRILIFSGLPDIVDSINITAISISDDEV